MKKDNRSLPQQSAKVSARRRTGCAAPHCVTPVAAARWLSGNRSLRPLPANLLGYAGFRAKVKRIIAEMPGMENMTIVLNEDYCKAAYMDGLTPERAVESRCLR